MKAIAKILGLTAKQTYWATTILNFLIVAGAIYYFSKSSIPAAFRARTAAIQKSMEEARKASAEASARLQQIEERLSRLDVEIKDFASTSEQSAKAEEERIRQTTEEEKRKIVKSAEQEIDAAANNARRDLKLLVAELAVSLAEKKIQVTDATDRVLVHNFVASLNDDQKNDGQKGRKS